ncbi:PKD domain-containing protein [Halorubrum sp. 2020YC2]|uniref:PKD domain-containing protein n=1 Tax=Halorubrum sp. 2020YC2 TaxID=2836432 RepID=UPI001BE85C3E|nr:PKD domain-containing protein [Halorubrum sp. 2020YC2]QWC18100.1 PKD domain-containing protein [Halorubrum sp. 2020YC2]
MIQDQAESDNTLFAMKSLPAGTDETDLVVELDEPLGETQVVEAWLWDGPAHESEVITVKQALVAVGEELDETIGITLVEAAPESGFNYPYYLFSPIDRRDGRIPMLVESNNTGTATDDFEEHRSAAKSLVRRGSSRPISEALGVPLLVPVFPRPAEEPVDWSHYTHQLDRQTVAIEEGPLARIDEQLLRMVEDAKDRLAGDEYAFTDEIMLNGFSASGNFADRFTALHPDRVLSVTAGGLNGMALLPHEEWNGHTLEYHVGVAGLESLTGDSVDVGGLADVNQLLYMGVEDTNDTIPYDDAWSEDLRELALAVYGEDMINDRFPRCQRAYDDADVEAQFRIYDDRGHRPADTEDLVEFHRRSLAGEDVSEFGERLGTVADIQASPANPRTGDAVTFDASDSRPNVGELVSYSWEFGDGQTAAGETVTHAYEESGSYRVTLSVTSDQGTTGETTREITARTSDDDGDAEDASAESAVTASFTVSPSRPSAGEEAAFDAGASSAETGELISYTWDFDDGDTAAGTDPRHAFSDPGTYRVTLSVVSDDGDSAETTNNVTVEEATADPQTEDADGSDYSTPGFGVPGALAGIGGAVQLLRRRLGEAGDDRSD